MKKTFLIASLVSSVALAGVTTGNFEANGVTTTSLDDSSTTFYTKLKATKPKYKLAFDVNVKDLGIGLGASLEKGHESKDDNNNVWLKYDKEITNTVGLRLKGKLNLGDKDNTNILQLNMKSLELSAGVDYILEDDAKLHLDLNSKFVKDSDVTLDAKLSADLERVYVFSKPHFELKSTFDFSPEDSNTPTKLKGLKTIGGGFNLNYTDFDNLAVITKADVDYSFYPEDRQDNIVSKFSNETRDILKDLKEDVKTELLDKASVETKYTGIKNLTLDGKFEFLHRYTNYPAKDTKKALFYNIVVPEISFGAKYDGLIEGLTLGGNLRFASGVSLAYGEVTTSSSTSDPQPAQAQDTGYKFDYGYVINPILEANAKYTYPLVEGLNLIADAKAIMSYKYYGIVKNGVTGDKAEPATSMNLNFDIVPKIELEYVPISGLTLNGNFTYKNEFNNKLTKNSKFETKSSLIFGAGLKYSW